MAPEPDALDVSITTFNCARIPVNPELFSTSLLSTFPHAPNQSGSKRVFPDVLVLSLQEIAPLSYSFLGGGFLNTYLSRFHDAISLLSTHGASRGGNGTYVHAVTRNVGMTAMLVFVRKDKTSQVASLGVAGVGTGWWEMGNKGAVGVRVGWAYSTEMEASQSSDAEGDDGEVLDLTFVAAHLAPMEDGLPRRNEDWANIVRKLIFTPFAMPTNLISASGPEQSGDSVSEDTPLLHRNRAVQALRQQIPEMSSLYTPTSHAFLAGDLNYRTSSTSPPSNVDQLFTDDATSRPASRWWTDLLSKDQLQQERSAGRTCHGFQEEPITFQPTYKYSSAAQLRAGTDTPSTSIEPESSQFLVDTYAQHRYPSWCDRVLYLPFPSWSTPAITTRSSSSSAPQIHQVTYTSLPLLPSSDHQPVTSFFSIPETALPVPVANSRTSTPSDSAGTDPRLAPPFDVDEAWARKRTVARLLEVLVGSVSWMTTTVTGLVVSLAAVVGIAAFSFRDRERKGWSRL